MTVMDADFALDPDLAELAGAVRGFAENRLSEPARQAEAADELTRALLEALTTQGLWTLGMAESHGGSGASLPALVVAPRELALVSGAAATAFARTHAVYLSVSGDAARRVADVAASGGLPVLIDSADPLTEVQVRDTGEEPRLDGTAHRVEGAGQAGLFVVHAGDRAMLVDPSSDGVTIGNPLRRTGLRGLAPHPVTLDGVAVPAATEPAHQSGWRSTHSLLLAAVVCGVAQSSMEAARHYCRERSQFGRRLIEFPSVAATLDDMANHLSICLTAVISAAYDFQRERRSTTSLARHCARTAVRVTSDAVQLHGGYGYLAEYPAERPLRDAVTLRALIALATSRAHPRSAGVSPDTMWSAGYRPTSGGEGPMPKETDS